MQTVKKLSCSGPAALYDTLGMEGVLLYLAILNTMHPEIIGLLMVSDQGGTITNTFTDARAICS